MKWIPLELRKASNLRREVDEAVRLFTEAQDSGDRERLSELRKLFSERIDQLEDFYLKHDDDERAVLFEKQRLRLRRCLHSGGGNHTATSGAESESEAAASPDMRSTTAHHSVQSPGHATQPRSAWAAESKHGRFSTVGGIHHPASIPGGGTQKAAAPTSGGGGTTRRKKQEVAQLYSWESPADAEASGDYGSEYDGQGANLSSSGERGHYVQADDGEHAANPGLFDVQIVLNAAEHKQLMSRQRSRRAVMKHTQRAKAAQEGSKKDGEFMFSASPYVDPNKVAGALYRTPKKDKWMNQTGFQRNQKTMTK
jgi:hypothetical protein